MPSHGRTRGGIAVPGHLPPGLLRQARRDRKAPRPSAADLFGAGRASPIFLPGPEMPDGLRRAVVRLLSGKHSHAHRLAPVPPAPRGGDPVRGGPGPAGSLAGICPGIWAGHPARLGRRLNGRRSPALLRHRQRRRHPARGLRGTHGELLRRGIRRRLRLAVGCRGRTAPTGRRGGRCRNPSPRGRSRAAAGWPAAGPWRPGRGRVPGARSPAYRARPRRPDRGSSRHSRAAGC